MVLRPRLRPVTRAACALKVRPHQPEVGTLPDGDAVIYFGCDVVWHQTFAVGLDLAEWIFRQLTLAQLFPCRIVPTLAGRQTMQRRSTRPRREVRHLRRDRLKRNRTPTFRIPRGENGRHRLFALYNEVQAIPGQIRINYPGIARDLVTARHKALWSGFPKELEQQLSGDGDSTLIHRLKINPFSNLKITRFALNAMV